MSEEPTMAGVMQYISICISYRLLLLFALSHISWGWFSLSFGAKTISLVLSGPTYLVGLLEVWPYSFTTSEGAVLDIFCLLTRESVSIQASG